MKRVTQCCPSMLVNRELRHRRLSDQVPRRRARKRERPMCEEVGAPQGARFNLDALARNRWAAELGTVGRPGSESGDRSDTRIRFLRGRLGCARESGSTRHRRPSHLRMRLVSGSLILLLSCNRPPRGILDVSPYFGFPSRSQGDHPDFQYQ